MKKIIFISIIILFGLSGCATYGGLSSTLPISNSSSVNSNVQIDNSGHIYTNASIGGYLR